MDTNAVMKALSQDEMTVISNIKALCEEIMQMQTGETMKADPAAETDPGAVEKATAPEQEMQETSPMDKPKEDKSKKAKKGVVETPSEVTTPESGAAGDIMEDTQPEQTEEKMKELGATLVKTLLGIQVPVKKAKDVNPYVATLNEIATAVKGLAENQKAHGEVIEKLLDGFGITEQLEIAQKAQLPAENRNAIVAKDGNDVIRMLVDTLNQVKKGTTEESVGSPLLSSNANRVRKNLLNPEMYSHLLGDKLTGGKED